MNLLSAASFSQNKKKCYGLRQTSKVGLQLELCVWSVCFPAFTDTCQSIRGSDVAWSSWKDWNHRAATAPSGLNGAKKRAFALFFPTKFFSSKVFERRSPRRNRLWSRRCIRCLQPPRPSTSCKASCRLPLAGWGFLGSHTGGRTLSRHQIGGRNYPEGFS